MQRTRREVAGFGSSVASVTRRIPMLVGAVAGLAGAASFGALIRQAFRAGDELAKLSDRLGITTAQLAAFNLAGRRAGASTAEVQRALESFIRRLGAASEGTGTAVAALDRLGLSAEELINMGTGEAVKVIADAMRGLGTQAERAHMAQELFGRGGLSMINVLQQGRGELEDAERAVSRFGTGLTRVDTAKIEMANNALTDVREAISGAAAQIAVRLAPAVQHLAERFVEAAGIGSTMGETVSHWFEKIGTAAAWVGDNVIFPMQVGFRAIQYAATRAVEFIVRGITKLIDLAARLPEWLGGGVAADAAQVGRMMADELARTSDELERQLANFATGPRTGERLAAFLKELERESNKAATAIAEAAQAPSHLLFDRTDIADGGGGRSSFDQIVRSRTVIGQGSSKRQRQPVEADPREIALLQQINEQLRGGIMARAS